MHLITQAKHTYLDLPSDTTWIHFIKPRDVLRNFETHNACCSQVMVFGPRWLCHTSLFRIFGGCLYYEKVAVHVYWLLTISKWKLVFLVQHRVVNLLYADSYTLHHMQRHSYLYEWLIKYKYHYTTGFSYLLFLYMHVFMGVQACCTKGIIHHICSTVGQFTNDTQVFVSFLQENI